MDGMQREELERLMFFEQTREKAAASYARNPKDADVFIFLSSLFGFLRNVLKIYVEDVNDVPHSFWRKKKQQNFGFSAFLELEMAFFIFFSPPLSGSCSCSCFWSCCVIILVCGWIYDKYGENE